MFNVLRKNQRVLMVVIAGLTIISFIWLYNRTNLSKVGDNNVASAYGRIYTRPDLEREVRNYRLALEMGQLDLLRDLGGISGDGETVPMEFLWNLIVLQHEAQKLGVVPTDGQIEGEIKRLPIFQTDGQFDARKYAVFLQEQLTPKGFTQRQLEAVIRDSISLKTIKSLVQSPLAASQDEVRDAFRALQKVDLGVIRFDASKVLASADPTAEEVEQFYRANAENLRVGESRSVRYLILPLAPADAALQGKERTKAEQQLADRASEIQKGIAPGKTLADASAKSGLTVSESPLLDHSGQVADGSPSATRDAGHFPALAAGAFRLRAEGQTDIAEDGGTYFVIELSKVAPARALSLEEARPRIVAALRARKAQAILRRDADAVLTQLRLAIKGGIPFDQAVKSAGLTAQTIDGIQPFENDASPEDAAFARASMDLQPGELGGLQPAPWGAFAVYLKSRAPLDEKVFQDRREEVTNALLEGKRQLLFLEWLRAARDAAQIRSLVPQRP